MSYSSGLGIFVVAAIVLCFLTTQLACNSIWGDGYYADHSWPKAAACLIASPIVWAVGKLIRRLMSKWVVDKHTGEVMRKPTMDHDVLFIPVRFWPALLVLLAIAFLIAELF